MRQANSLAPGTKATHAAEGMAPLGKPVIFQTVSPMQNRVQSVETVKAL